MRIEVFANLDLERDAIELDDNMTEAEIEEAVCEYVLNFLDWGYEIIDEDDE